VLVTFGIVRTDVNGWGSATTLGTLAGGLVLLAAFVAIEARFSRRPLVPLDIFATRTVTASNVVVFFMGSAVFAMWYFVSRYLQQVLGYSAIEAGLAFLPMTAGIAVASTVAGRLSGRVGAGRVLSGGMVLIAIGMLGFSFVSADGTFWSDVLVPGVVTAVGLGFSFVPVTIAATAGVERTRAGLASGLVNTSRQLGGSLGLAVLATVATSAATGPTGAGLTDGFRVAFLVGAGFAVLGAVTSLGGLSRVPRPVPA
jgi:predicted MFS family arabinose efflux permease